MNKETIEHKPIEQIKWVNIKDLVPNKKNINVHPIDQIERLAEIIKFQGFRNPIIVSNQSGFIVAGHGRLEAAKLAGMDKVPVMYQDFTTTDQEYAFMVSDNAIASWAELDFKLINLEIPELHLPSIDLLGIKDFTIDPLDGSFPELSGEDPAFQQRTFILSNEQNDILNEAMEKIEKEGFWEDEINKNKNGNLLAAILKKYV